MLPSGLIAHGSRDMILDNWLKRFRGNEWIGSYCDPEENNTIRRALAEIEGVGCHVDKTRDGRGWRIVIDGTSDTQPPPDYVPIWGASACITGGAATTPGLVAFNADDHETNADVLDADEANDRITVGVDGAYGIMFQGRFAWSLVAGTDYGPTAAVKSGATTIFTVQAEVEDWTTSAYDPFGSFSFSGCRTAVISAGTHITVDYNETSSADALSNGILSVHFIAPATP